MSFVEHVFRRTILVFFVERVFRRTVVFFVERVFRRTPCVFRRTTFFEKHTLRKTKMLEKIIKQSFAMKNTGILRING